MIYHISGRVVSSTYILAYGQAVSSIARTTSHWHVVHTSYHDSLDTSASHSSTLDASRPVELFVLLATLPRT